MDKRIEQIKEELLNVSKREINIMEVCGTHTMSLAQHGTRSMLPENINIISGPGCPVCVTSQSDIKVAIDLAKRDDFIITTFGDMLKVPCEQESLQQFSNVKILYSPFESLKIARENPNKQIVFLGVGFETTAPLIASTIEMAQKESVFNFSVLPMHKTVPVAMEAILGAENNKIHGLLLPGHVGSITGRKYFDFVKKFEVSGVVAGFDALGIMEAIYLLTRYFNEGKCEVTNNYQKIVSEDGNKVAMETLYRIFEDGAAEWRGIGVIPNSGLIIRSEYEKYDAIKKFNLEAGDIEDPKGCLCGPILMGKAKPKQCKHFGTSCVPSNPVGPCMVSSEGTCAAYYKYGVN